MHVDRIPNRTSPPAFLLRETYREGGKVKKRTLANITQWPVAKIEALRRLLRDEYAPHEPRADLKLMRSLPHGHVAAALGMLRKERVVLVGDRGMITEARIEEVLKPAGLDWITPLRAPAIRSLAEAGSLQLSLFDERDLATITSPDYPGERLVACRNPLLADERARKREDLLVATEKKLAAIAARVHRAKKPLRGKGKIALAIGRVIDKYKMAKHFDLNITDDRFTFARNTAKIDAEAALDGVYVVRTTVAEAVLDQTATVTAYKQLSTAERAFRSLKTVDLEVRPIYHRRADRVRAHVFLCMLAYYVEWHMRQ